MHSAQRLQCNLGTSGFCLAAGQLYRVGLLTSAGSGRARSASARAMHLLLPNAVTQATGHRPDCSKAGATCSMDPA